MIKTVIKRSLILSALLTLFFLIELKRAEATEISMKDLKRSSVVVYKDYGITSRGSGVLIAPGYILTAAHVITNKSIFTTFDANIIHIEYDNSFYLAHIAKLDSGKDLALLKIGKNIGVPIQLNSTIVIKEGDVLYSVSSPKIYKSVFTKGQVLVRSTCKYLKNCYEQRMADTHVLAYEMAQTFGSSGAGVVTKEGYLAGIVSMTDNDIHYMLAIDILEISDFLKGVIFNAQK